jgi:UDP-2-acetamido-3-amino-2,3-dideoxy-glucuronate N-acetyltransferase
MSGIACVGAGRWGKKLARTFNELRALRSICEINSQTRVSLTGHYPDALITANLQDILDDPQIRGVCIATPAATHASLVRRALIAGKDVFVEKPLALVLDEATALVELAASHNSVLMIGHILWYHPAMVRLKELVARGDLGRIRYIYSNRLNLGTVRNEENILWSFAPHDISAILGLLNETPNHVHAEGGSYINRSIPDITVTLLSFPSGVKAHIFVSWLHPFKDQRLIVVGEQKMAVFDDTVEKDKLVIYPHSVTWDGNLPVVHKAEGEAVPVEISEPLNNECRHFLECIETRQTPRTDGLEALRVLSVLQQCQAGLDGSKLATAAGRRSYFAHESAFIDDDVVIGEGTTIWHVSHIMKGSRLGKHCRIGQNVVIGPDAAVGDGVKIQNNVSVYKGVILQDAVFCGPSVVFTNVVNPRSEVPRMDELKPTLVRRGASLGANCTIVCGTTIGEYAFVGAGAVVTRDVPDYALVMGNPARRKGWMCECGTKLKQLTNEFQCPSCGKQYYERDSCLRPLEPTSGIAPLI